MNYEIGQELPLEVKLETADDSIDPERSEISCKKAHIKVTLPKIKKSKKKCKYCMQEIAHDKCCFTYGVGATVRKSSSPSKRPGKKYDEEARKPPSRRSEDEGIDPKMAFVRPESKSWTCRVCKFEAEDSEEMRDHVRTHEKKKKYSCDVCTYSTDNKRTRDRHTLIHYNFKPYECSHCPYKSSRKDNLYKHKRTVHHLDV